MEIRENIPLKSYTTFKIGGPARYFANVTTEDELREAVLFAKEKNLIFFVLGGGSNVLISDEGINGIVAKISIKGIDFDNLGDGKVRLVVGAGENWDEIVKVSAGGSLFGIENLSGIPGLAGAAPVQNIGAYGAEISEVIESVNVFNIETKITTKFYKKDCRFGYRTSIFKENPGRFVITKITLLLNKNGRANTSYKDFVSYFGNTEEDKIFPKDVREAVLQIRSGKFPDLKNIGTAGSFFKNPVVDNEKAKELIDKFEDLQVFPSDGMSKISAAYLIDKVGGWKSFRKNDAGVWDKQALVLVNHGNASASEINFLAEKVSEDIKNKTGVVLEREVISFP